MYCSRCLCSSCGKKIAATRAMDTATGADTTAITQFISTATTQFISTATTHFISTATPIVNTPIMTFKALVCTCAGHVWYFPRDVLSSGVESGVNVLLNSPTSRGSVQSLILESIDNPRIRQSVKSFVSETNALSFYMPVVVLSMAVLALSTTAVALSSWGPKLPPPIQPPPPPTSPPPPQRLQPILIAFPPTSPPPPQRLQPILIAFPFLIPSASEQG